MQSRGGEATRPPRFLSCAARAQRAPLTGRGSRWHNPRMQTVRWIVAAAVFLALLFLSLQNSDPATLKFFSFASWQAPLVVIVFVAFAGGVAVGLLAGALRAARLKRQIQRMRREHAGERGRASGAAAMPGIVPATGPGFTRGDRLPDGL
jgi:uncharacterized integral membrane protein